MNPINLIDYTHSEVTIPQDFLDGTFKEPIPAVKTLTAFLLDFVIVFSFNFLSCLILAQSLNSLLVPQFAERFLSSALGFSLILFPVILCAYFNFCYFFNQGQSLGQQVLKIRIGMPDKNFSSALKAGLVSAVITLSGGILFKWAIKKLQVEHHDYLYQDLVTLKEIAAPQLMQLLDVKEEEKELWEIKEAA